jgi:threonine/homoserine/homoserine lactone efflux protein
MVGGTVLLKGVLVGFSIAAPVGPIGLLCIQRTITYGPKSGLATGLGAATADGLYGSVAGFGLTAISSFLVGQQFWLRLVGGAFLFYLGTRTFLSRPAEKAAASNHTNLLSDYSSTVFLTVTNPLTILSFAAVFAGIGLANPSGGNFSPVLLVAGVLLGSTLWWSILSAGVSLLRFNFKSESLVVVNRISGAILVGFAIFAFASILRNAWT